MDQNEGFNPEAFLSPNGVTAAPEEAAPAEPVPAAPVPEAPDYRPPEEFAPVYQAPAESAPAEQPSAGPAPAEQAPAAADPYQPSAEPSPVVQEAPAYRPPAEQPPAYRPPVAQTADPYSRPGYGAEPERSAPPVYPRTPDPAAADPKPHRKSAYAPMSSVGMAVQLFLMNIPVIGLILSIIWACGVCRKIARRNLARAWLILLIVGILLTVAGVLVLRFCFTEQLTRAFEQLYPGYTIHWG